MGDEHARQGKLKVRAVKAEQVKRMEVKRV